MNRLICKREIVGEIAEAWQEQPQGIDQINKVVAKMDKVVQQNAANAEESACAAEETNSQANYLKDFVEDLTGLIGGESAGTITKSISWSPAKIRGK